MDAFTDFIMTMNHPPNPYRNLDDSLATSLTVPSQSGGGAPATGNAASGLVTFTTTAVDGPFTCAGCHALPTGSNGMLLGSMGVISQDFKVPQLRDTYEKIGFLPNRNNIFTGGVTNIGLFDQPSGFGFLHDGEMSLTELLGISAFNMSATTERNVFAFVLAFPSESAPCVGRQVTVIASNKADSTVAATTGTLVAQAEATRCDVIAKATQGGIAPGYAYNPSSNLLDPDTLTIAPLGESALRASIAGSDVRTYTRVPPRCRPPPRHRPRPRHLPRRARDRPSVRIRRTRNAIPGSGEAEPLPPRGGKSNLETVSLHQPKGRSCQRNDSGLP